MKVTAEILTTWKEAYTDALVTVKKKPIQYKIPPKRWKLSMLIAEHSPIRSVLYRIKFEDIPYWVAMHLQRHYVGIEKFVSTQRQDRTDSIIERDTLSQGALVNMNIVLNAQSWINISRKRLCSCSSKETREAWKLALSELEKIDPELRSVCVEECIYKGFCPEIKSCGYTETIRHTNQLLKYRRLVTEEENAKITENNQITNRKRRKKFVKSN